MPNARDLKGRNMSHKKPMSGLAWMFSGLAIGLFAAFLVYLDKQPAEEISFTEAVKQELEKARTKNKDAAETKKKSLGNTATTKDKPTKKIEKPKFEFYTILSELEVFIPEPEIETERKHKKPKTTSKSTITHSTNKVKDKNRPKSKQKNYLLQAGSFKNKQDAERLKASLALLGVQSSIQSININKDNWHRVRIGPFSNPDRLHETLATLKQNNIRAMTMELK